MRSGPGAARTILLFHIISARPPKQPLFFSRGLGRRMHLGVEVTESSTNKQHHLFILALYSTHNRTLAVLYVQIIQYILVLFSTNIRFLWYT